MIHAPTKPELERMRASYGQVHSKSQILQDMFVLRMLGHRPGYFVEFGAANGVQFSNSYLLEKRFHWQGLLAEPAKTWHPTIEANRTARLDKRCVWSSSGRVLTFCEHPDANLSALQDYAGQDARSRSKFYEVETVSLRDLLDGAGAPEVVDYLSVDTEGSELDILGAYDFSRHFCVVTVEHNHVAQNREAVHDLMALNGYVRLCEDFSDFDDWYVRASIFDGGR